MIQQKMTKNIPNPPLMFEWMKRFSVLIWVLAKEEGKNRSFNVFEQQSKTDVEWKNCTWYKKGDVIEKHLSFLVQQIFVQVV
jgi:hypothetical protein